jgi:hypothetical protein
MIPFHKENSNRLSVEKVACPLFSTLFIDLNSIYFWYIVIIFVGR